MGPKQLGGAVVTVNEEGFLLQLQMLGDRLDDAIAQEEGITLGPEHWKVLDFVRRDAGETGEAPNIRRITKVGGVATKDLYTLFPGGPGKKAAKIAGYPKPHGCI